MELEIYYSVGMKLMKNVNRQLKFWGFSHLLYLIHHIKITNIWETISLLPKEITFSFSLLVMLFFWSVVSRFSVFSSFFICSCFAYVFTLKYDLIMLYFNSIRLYIYLKHCLYGPGVGIHRSDSRSACFFYIYIFFRWGPVHLLKLFELIISFEFLTIESIFCTVPGLGVCALLYWLLNNKKWKLKYKI